MCHSIHNSIKQMNYYKKKKKNTLVIDIEWKEKKEFCIDDVYEMDYFKDNLYFVLILNSK